jgi:hypothetical protein
MEAVPQYASAPGSHSSVRSGKSRLEPTPASQRSSRAHSTISSHHGRQSYDSGSHQIKARSRSGSQRDSRSVYSQEHSEIRPASMRSRAQTLRDEAMYNNASSRASTYSTGSDRSGTSYGSGSGPSLKHSIADLEAELKEMKAREQAERKYQQRVEAAECEFRFATDKEYRDSQPKPKRWVGEYKVDLAWFRRK